MIYSQELQDVITIAEIIYFVLTKKILITKKELENLTTETIVPTMPGIDGLTEVVLELLKDSILLQDLPISNFINSGSSIYQDTRYFFDKQTNQIICDIYGSGVDTWGQINDDAKFLLIKSIIVDKNDDAKFLLIKSIIVDKNLLGDQ